MTDRTRRPPARLLLAVLVVASACSAPAAARPGLPAFDAITADRAERPSAAPAARPLPTAGEPAGDRAAVPQAPPSRAPAPTRAPAPVPVATPTWEPFAMDLYRDGDFVSQATRDWCVPGAIHTMINLIEPRPDSAVAPPGQAGLDRLARSLSTDRLVGAGSEPEGWAGALNELGYGPYEVRSEPTREAALEVAARALRMTGRPVGLLVWRGAHAWVLSGFEASADPASTDDFDLTHVRVEDPWHPRTSSIWGPGQPPNTRIPVARLAEDYLPWRRPTVRYPEKDGRFVLVVPVVAPAG